ncbi:hypothetical protein GIB67_039811 [Kingdonia uniflora]|uniref:Uncharacterized protein n=1 Tax=Kingdonia uniflora TaxID=39325 RepID=A0A7J7P3E4_9MAGN|nr:hypothetical protein GIB67_039811 [Kingdonia uniflora]
MLLRNLYTKPGRHNNCIPDEHYVQTLLAMGEFEDELERRTLTYTSWNESKAKMEKTGWYPVTFRYTTAGPQQIREIKGISHHHLGNTNFSIAIVYIFNWELHGEIEISNSASNIWKSNHDSQYRWWRYERCHPCNHSYTPRVATSGVRHLQYFQSWMVRRGPFASARETMVAVSGPKYDGKYLHSLIKENLGGTRLRHTLTNVVIPTFDIKRLQPTIFSSFEVKNKPSLDALLSDICISTSAAPTFLPAHHFVNEFSHGKVREFNLIDGCYNPIKSHFNIFA